MFYQLLFLLGFFTAASTDTPPARVHPKIIQAKIFCKQQGYDTSVVFMIDFAIHNGRKRFFVCDLATGAILKSGLVTHGSCNARYLSEASFSNEQGCGCSSMGKYKVGSFYKGRFGDAYKLYGLDSTNSNAYNRYIVLHSHSCVPDNEIYPSQICNSQGCTTVSPSFLKELETVIAKKKKPILMWAIWRI
jgi:hypothetical protein